ncbi:neck protein [Mycobacterium phage Rem711]|uniref:Head-to-tail connector protein n=1 Tax=Mycobacterium phage Rem711 TaxID=2079285 RepID=A0A2K9VEX1_9CAUD|nr:neck protein [Mycobacterium phage Rem711]AUV60794.1 head-to-tail connector protein [Mycobacterium phage Rem711]
MAPKRGFVLNKRNIGRILKEDAGIGAALDAIAEPVAASAGGTVDKYVTDRQARAVVVSAEEQAINGAATKALGETGRTLT